MKPSAAIKPFVVAIMLFILISINLFAAIQPTRLTCEYLESPLVDIAQPLLAWVNIADEGERGQNQTAWQVRVASLPELLNDPDLWDSGKIESAQSNRVSYAGRPLQSRQECWWQVRVWDRDDEVSEWSEPAMWRMGFMHPDEWQAEWIGAPWQGEEPLPKPPGGPDAYPQELPPPAPLLRKAFQLNKPVKKAVAYVTGLGYFELYLNGDKVGNDELVPNQTNYGKRPELIHENIPLPDQFSRYKVMYLAYDIKDYLQQGENVVGSILGNGFYNAPKYWMRSYGSPRFIGQLHITYEDGTEDIIKSDASWKAAKSAILMDLVFHGEVYDARQEQPGWNASGFDAADWQPAALRQALYGELVAHTAATDKVTQRLQPVSIEKLDNGNIFVDFGVEISGRVFFHNIEGPAGHRIDITYNANLYSGDHSYTFGEGPTDHASRFNWFVFSGVEIANWPGELKPEQITAEAINTEIEETAVFETSNSLFNDINKIWKRSQLDNMHGGLASDCPHRERAGYTGDGQVACVTVMHNYDARNFYQKWITDMREAQLPSGYVPNGAPWEPGCGGGPAWGAAICIMPWEFYLHYGSLDMLADNFDAMKGYVNYMQTWVDEDGIMFSQRPGRDGEPLRWFNLGDWAFPGKSLPNEMVHTFYLWRCADLTANAAKALGRMNDAAIYASLADRTKSAFHKKYYNDRKGSYGQYGANVFALKMGVPEAKKERVVAALKTNIEKNDGHLDTGIFGTQFFFEILAENGLNDLAYVAMNKRTFPSYGYWLEDGATTTREQWNNSGSHNHPMFGGGLVWLYRKLAGMQADPALPGYKHIIFRPQPVADLTDVTYSNLTPYGRAGISWRQEDAFEMDVTVPVGSQATVYVPAASGQDVFESGRLAESRMDIEFMGMDDGYAVFQVASGEYSFQVR